jgi:hypothetical protein
VVAARGNEQVLRDLPGNVRAEAAATHPAASFERTGSGERAGPQAFDTPANRATFPAEVMTRAIAPQAIAAVIAFWSATPRPQSAERYCLCRLCGDSQ